MQAFDEILWDIREVIYPRRRPQRGPHDVFASRILASALAQEESLDPHVVKRLKRLVRKDQRRAYECGSAFPQKSVVNLLSQVVPAVAEIARWPRGLLEPWPLSKPRFTQIVNDFVVANGFIEHYNLRKRLETREFCNWDFIDRSGGPMQIGTDPQRFWCRMTLVRAAEIAGDVEGFRANFIKLVTETTLLASHPAVQMHCEVLFRLIEALFAICPGYPMPILIDWDVVRSAVAASIRGDSGEQAFYPFVQYDFVPRCSCFGRTQPLGEVLSDGNVGRKYRSLDEDVSDHASVFRAPPKPEPKATIVG